MLGFPPEFGFGVFFGEGSVADCAGEGGVSPVSWFHMDEVAATDFSVDDAFEL